MPYDEALAARVRDHLRDEPGLSEKAMFGGLAFLLDGKMSVGVRGGELLVRVGAEHMDAALREPHTRESPMGKRAMKGFILAVPETDDELAAWVRRGVDLARSLGT
jgi:TfoX/Sxy family transcriptional regulator of competence genes